MLKHKAGFQLFCVWLSWRLGLVFVGLSAHKFLPKQLSYPHLDVLLQNFPWPEWLDRWAGFDGFHYLHLAEKGYLGTGLVQAFFPVWPLMIGGFVQLTKFDYVISGLILATFFSFTSLKLLTKAWQQILGFNKSRWALAWWLIFPTSFFLGAFYNEGLFLTLAVSCYLAAKHKKWWLAGGLAAVASATRVVGIWLVPMIWLMAAEDNFSWATAGKWIKQHFKPILAGSLGVIGLLAYMYYLDRVFHDPLYFLHQQSEFGAGRQETLVIWPQVIWRAIKILLTARPFDWKYFSYTQDLIFGVGSVGILIWGWWQRKTTKITPALLVYGLGCVLMPTFTGTFSSLPRYVLAAWPIWQILAVWSVKQPKLAWLSLAFSLILLIINTALFIQGYWVA